MINNFCLNISPALQLIGTVITIFKIAIPLVLICLGIIDIAKAILSSKKDSLKTCFKNLLIKVCICIVIFFLPTIFMILFGFVADFNRIKNDSGIDYDVCYKCLFSPSNNTCIDAVIIASTN